LRETTLFFFFFEIKADEPLHSETSSSIHGIGRARLRSTAFVWAGQQAAAAWAAVRWASGHHHCCVWLSHLHEMQIHGLGLFALGGHWPVRVDSELRTAWLALPRLVPNCLLTLVAAVSAAI